MENISQWVGIDISKATLDFYLRPLGKAMKVNNTEEDISKLVETLKSYMSTSSFWKRQEV
ncbi:hypothetical protein myaer87_43390 [Microcystis aeruginosa NIES-87]|nr:hypothetical protein myaer87_43390 [Microcystis aeruginosa NIES-87]